MFMTETAPAWLHSRRGVSEVIGQGAVACMLRLVRYELFDNRFATIFKVLAQRSTTKANYIPTLSFDGAVVRNIPVAISANHSSITLNVKARTVAFTRPGC